ncbi:hypothetical protein BUALT_Bualt07G0025500 [Buddleja alternifolia]|uniref:Protein FAR1-RELATED SEQUENCE n=1 Tax=Buddleja alternifolia TaxID=168488 RepID=A0AAV6XFD2_9LAMI|nr:hypothetical protein BUALT_Bualt07G0025500 [Buddleja alternifolia]
MNSVLKRYVSYKHNLLQFFHHFDRLVDDRRHEELKADLRSSQSKPVASFPVEILKHAATVYTHEVFELFQEELRKAYDAKIELFGEVGETFEYKITPFRKHRQNTVIYDSSEGKVSCSCKKFEFAGILCSHALKVLSLRNIIRIPELYIKKRWTKKAKKTVVQEQIVEVNTERSTSMDEKEERKMIGVHCKELCGLSNQLVTRASMTTETFRIAKVGLLKMIEEIDVSLENGADMRPILGSKFVVQKARKQYNETAIRGWKNKEKKPVRSEKRLKSGLEMSILKKKKPKHINITASNNTITNAADIEQNVNSAKNCPGIGASFDSSSYSSSSQLSQTFNPIVHQQLSLSPYYSRQDEQNGMSLTELLQQQLVKTQGVERFQWNNSTNESNLEKINEERGDVPKG